MLWPPDMFYPVTLADGILELISTATSAVIHDMKLLALKFV